MRDIKFRAFIKKLGWMVSVERINFDCKTIEVDLSDGNGDTSEYDFNEVELMQYTGLKDKNGKELYEGDLCKELDKDGKETEELLQILWSEYYQFQAKVIIGGTLTKGLSFPLWHWDNRKENGFRQLEIIGNIYTAPELLKEEQINEYKTNASRPKEIR